MKQLAELFETEKNPHPNVSAQSVGSSININTGGGGRAEPALLKHTVSFCARLEGA